MSTHLSITREGCYYLLVFAMVMTCALVREVNLLLLLAGMLVGPLSLSHFLARRTLYGLSVERRLPHAVCAGDLLVVNLQLNNPRRRLGCWSVVVDDCMTRIGEEGSKMTAGRASGAEMSARILFPYVAARQSGKGAYRGRLIQRGRYRLGPIKISTRFPFGLFRYTMTTKATAKTASDASASVLVLPRLGKLTRRWMMRQHESFSGSHRRERTPGQDGDFYGIRPWQRGDARRLLHARTTARAGSPMVRQFEQPRNRDLALLVDLWKSPSPSLAELENIELAVSFTATAIGDLCRRGASEVFLAMHEVDSQNMSKTDAKFPAKPQAAITGGPASGALMQDMLSRLALVDGQSGDTLVELLDLATRRIAPDTELVIVTTRPCDVDALANGTDVSADLRRRIKNRTIRLIDTSSAELAEFYQPE